MNSEVSFSGEHEPHQSAQIKLHCDEFENRWREGQRPDLESFLTRLPHAIRPEFLRKALAIELEQRHNLGEQPNVGEYRDRFPEYDLIIEAIFAITRSAEGNLSDERGRDVDRLLREFRQRWMAERHSPIEEFLNRLPSSLRSSALLDLVVLEVQLRREQGEFVSVAEYEQRFPHDASTIGNAFCRLETRSYGLQRPTMAHRTRSESPDLNQGQIRIPRCLGRYVVEKELGRGSFGLVLLGRDTKLDRPVALKLPNTRQFSSSTDIAAFVQEARNAARLNHPGLVSVYDVEIEGGTPYIVQEFIDGCELATWQIQAEPKWATIAKLVIDIAAALGHAHQQGFVHRDLKPSNIIVDSCGKPHIADFGLTLHESEQRYKEGDIAGTPPYMSPEQTRGDSHLLDGRTDIWSLGVILYELLVKRRPFEAKELKQLYHDIQHRDPKPPRQIVPAVPSALERVCLKCLQRAPTDRYSCAAALVEDLESRYVKGTVEQYDAVSDHDQPVARIFVACRGQTDFLSRITNRLKELFGSSSIVAPDYRDFDLHDSRNDVSQTISHCNLLLLVIDDSSPGLPSADLGASRDPLTIAVEAAFCHRLIVIPLLIGEAQMPAISELPRSIAQLAQGIPSVVRPNADFESQIGQLVARIDRLMPNAEKSSRSSFAHKEKTANEQECQRIVYVAVEPPAVGAPTNLGFEESGAQGQPNGWFDGFGYVSGVSRDYRRDMVRRKGSRGMCASLSRRGRRNKGFGVLMQRAPAHNLVGKRLRIAAELCSENLDDWAGLWLRIDGGASSLFFDNMSDRPVTKSTPWTKYAIETRIPSGSCWLNYGLILVGNGQLLVDNFEVEC